VQDIAALIALEGGQLECLVAHDWGGAVAWNLAAGQPALMKKLAIINSPHPGTFLRELQHSPAQQAASAYMNFLIRPDAEALLAEDDFRRLWEFFTHMGAADGPHAWLTDAVREQYRAIWRQGLTGPCNYYRASPLRPPRPGPPHNDPAAAAVAIPREMLEVHLPTLVLWAMDDIALPAALLDGLEDYVPQMELHRIEGATHWIVHEQPALVAATCGIFCVSCGSSCATAPRASIQRRLAFRPRLEALVHPVVLRRHGAMYSPSRAFMSAVSATGSSLGKSAQAGSTCTS
jgi:pimeloyl-ACP methyl ester carboxylesterase